VNPTVILQPLFGLVAWSYVALRVIHSLIHLTYNTVMHRLTVFAVSNFVLGGLWVALFFAMPR
jgi:hypothetical protein